MKSVKMCSRKIFIFFSKVNSVNQESAEPGSIQMYGFRRNKSSSMSILQGLEVILVVIDPSSGGYTPEIFSSRLCISTWNDDAQEGKRALPLIWEEKVCCRSRFQCSPSVSRRNHSYQITQYPTFQWIVVISSFKMLDNTDLHGRMQLWGAHFF